MTAQKISEVIRNLESRAPSGTAEEWDNVGLLVGDPEWRTAGAVVSIDLTDRAIAKAKSRGYRLIVTHHPCIFPKGRGLGRVIDAGASKLVFRALREGIAVAAFHTNFDRCSMEVVRTVAAGLGARPVGRLIERSSGSLVKLAVFVPRDYADRVRDAICDAGAGQIGNYDYCTFSSGGEGTFRGSDQTRPFIGKAGFLERADEFRLETILPRGLEGSVLAAMRKAHPYEEVAYDFYPVEQGPANLGLVRGLGYGFWGEFDKARSFSEIVKDVKRLFKIDGFWLTEPAPSRITRVKRVGFVAGKGSSFLGAAIAAGCELFITGEAGYHDALDGSRNGMAVMELGHRESERFFLTTMEAWLSIIGLRSVSLDQPTQRIQLR